MISPSESHGYKLVALIIALILWLTVHGRRDFERVVKIPVKIKASAELEVLSPLTEAVEVKVIGNRRGLKELQRVSPLRVEVKQAGLNRLPIKRSDIRFPVGVRLIWIRPEYVEVTARRKSNE